ncbi:MAG: hypothetical protein QW046_04730 [Candidatus Micrarchaeaceae archaeon]
MSQESRKIEDIEKEILAFSVYGNNVFPSRETNSERNLNYYFVSELYNKMVQFHYTGKEKILIIVTQRNDDIFGTYVVDLAPEDIVTLPESICQQLQDEKLGLMQNGSPELNEPVQKGVAEYESQ